MKVLSARVEDRTFYNEHRRVIHVEFDKEYGKFAGRYEKRGVLYRGEEGDAVRFFAYTGPGRGFGGAHFDITLLDGTPVTLIGPWSSRAGAVNKFFPDREPVVEVLYDRNVVAHVRKDALVRVGIQLEPIDRWGDSEVYWEPI